MFGLSMLENTSDSILWRIAGSLLMYEKCVIYLLKKLKILLIVFTKMHI